MPSTHPLACLPGVCLRVRLPRVLCRVKRQDRGYVGCRDDGWRCAFGGVVADHWRSTGIGWEYSCGMIAARRTHWAPYLRARPLCFRTLIDRSILQAIARLQAFVTCWLQNQQHCSCSCDLAVLSVRLWAAHTRCACRRCRSLLTFIRWRASYTC